MIARISSGKAILSYLDSEKKTTLATTHDIELTVFLEK
jgi:DNA mismatch repair ATPase MutS